MCERDVIGAPSIFKFTRIAAALARIYTPRMHSVGRGIGTPKDRDEVLFIMNR